MRSITGKAFVVAGSNNSKLRVQFFWPFRGDYWIIDLADDYSYAVVGTQNRKYLWVLARTTSLDNAVYQSIMNKIESLEFNINLLKMTSHF